MKKILLALEDEMLAAIDVAMKDVGIISRSALIRVAVKEFIDKRKLKPKTVIDKEELMPE